MVSGYIGRQSRNIRSIDFLSNMGRHLFDGRHCMVVLFVSGLGAASQRQRESHFLGH